VAEGVVKPDPDPTVLTTQLVDRALSAYRDVVDTRLAAIDRATELLAPQLERIAADALAGRANLREDIDRQLAALREVTREWVDRVADVAGEKFSAIETRILERDTRVAQAADDSRISLDAALAAAKEAVGQQNAANAQAIAKSEVATQKQIDAIATLMATGQKATDDKIADLKSRLDLGEGGQRGAVEVRTEQRAGRDESRLNMGQVLLAVSIVIAAVSLALALKH
jgi:hypothetical protein